jgi:hypothetical protein
LSELEPGCSGCVVFAGITARRVGGVSFRASDMKSLPQPDWFAGGGATGALIRATDWARTPVGPVSGWPRSLKTAVSICLGSRHPIVIWWGKETLIQFYNDAYISFLGSTKHPGGHGAVGARVLA